MSRVLAARPDRLALLCRCESATAAMIVQIDEKLRRPGSARRDRTEFILTQEAGSGVSDHEGAN